MVHLGHVLEARSCKFRMFLDRTRHIPCNSGKWDSGNLIET